MSIVDLFNGFEAAFWFSLASFVFWRFGHRESPTRGVALWTTGWLFLFGVSDVIEVFTGAWWRPLGLLILKGACLFGLAYCGWRAIKARDKPDSAIR